MADLFHLNISTPKTSVFDGDVQSIVAPAEMGYVGILANHAPFITTLGPGRIIIRDSAGKPEAYPSNSGGFLEILNNKATILLDSIEDKA